MLLLLALLIGATAQAQYNPNNPDEPGARPWQLTLRAIPTAAGYFSLNQQTIHAEGEQMRLVAYTYNNYRFVQWEDEKGNILSTERNLDYIMPAANVTLVARYEYTPGNPNEPGQASIKRRLTLKTNPEGAGRFNLSSSNDISAGETVNLRAYSNANYYFRNWAQNGTVVSTSSGFAYTMPDHDVTLVANFDYDYQPNSPNEPGQPTNTYCYIYSVRMDAKAGQTIYYPLYLEDRGTAVTGLQVDISLPKGFTTDEKAMSLTDRATAHSLKAEQASEGLWHIFVSGSQAIEGESGPILTIPIHIPDTATVGQVFTVNLANGLVVKEGGVQQAVNVRNGSLKIMRSGEEQLDSPDYIVTNLQPKATEVVPGGNITLTWQVKNQGNMTGYGGWTERIYLVALDGRKVSIGSASYETNEFQSGASVSRNATITLAQLPGIDGKVDVAVTIVPNGNSGEISNLITNNTAQTEGQPITVGKRLVLTVPNKAQKEGETTNIRCQLARSGSWTKAETFKLTKLKGDERILIPETVVIPREMASAYFYLTLTNDDKCNTDSVVNLLVDGNGYDAVEGSFVVTDDELMPLSLIASMSEVAEGETFQLTVNLAKPAEKPLTVSLTPELPKRFRLPASVVIPAGQTKGSVDVTAVDNETPDGDVSCSFIAYASGYEPAEAIIILKDNDLPVLDLTLTPDKVKENDGPVCITGTLRRITNIDKKVTVRLSDDSNGGLYFSQKKLVLAKGVQQANFNFGPVDNSQVDGDRLYTITAAVWLSSCSCSASGQAAGNIVAKLQVFDDDGPALTLTSSQATVREGVTTRLTVTRNTSMEQSLTVRLSSEHDDLLTYSHTLVIPAGQPSAYVEVTPNANDTQNDSQTIVFTAEAEGFSSGTCYVLVTDQTLPDAVITDISIAESEVEAGGLATFSVTVKNQGISLLPAQTRVNIYAEGKSETLRTIYTQEELSPNASNIITRQVEIATAPDEKRFYAVVNEEKRVNELSYNNNTSMPVALKVLSPYQITIKSDKSLYLPGEEITLSGTVTGSKSANVEVEVYIIKDGARQIFTTVTNEKGQFSTNFTPYGQQMGNFVYGACYPNEGIDIAYGSFDYVGLRRTSQQYISCDVIVGTTYTGIIEMENPTSIIQNNIHVEILSVSDNCEVSFVPVSSVPANSKFELQYTINAKDATSGTDWENIKVRIVSEEGAHTNISMYCYCRVPQAQLSLEISEINTTITKGRTRDYPIIITNKGVGETGRIFFSLPSMMQTGSSTEMASLKSGETTTAILRLLADDNMQLNVPVTGQIGINCENGKGVALPYNIIPVSNSNGELMVDVCDEYTYYTEGAPHVKGAKVKIQRPLTMEVLYEGITGDDGIFFIDLQEGYYTLSVSADKHESYERNILIDPKRRNNIIVNLSYEGGVSVEWNAVETEIEDEYSISSTLTYETNVPVPILDLKMPDRIPANDLAIGESILFYATLTNRGLIAIHEAQIILPDNSPGLIFESLQDTPGDLMAQQSIVIPVKVTRVDYDLNSKRSAHSAEEKEIKLHCAEIIIPFGYWDCGVDRKWYRRGGKELNLGRMCTSIELAGLRERSELPLLGRLSGANFNPYIPNIPDIIPPINLNYDGCEPCLQSRMVTIVDCGLSLYSKTYGVLKDIVECILEANENINSIFDNNGQAKQAEALLKAATVCSSAIFSAKGGEDLNGALKTTLSLLDKTVRRIENGVKPDWDYVVESLGDFADILSKSNDFGFEGIKELICPLKLLEPCKLGLSSEKSSTSASMLRSRRMPLRASTYSEPAYIRDYQKSISYGLLDMLAIVGMKKVLFGDEVWLEADSEDLSSFYHLFVTMLDENETIPLSNIERLLEAKPDNINEAQVNEFVSRWNNTTTNSSSDNYIDVERAISFMKIIDIVQKQLISLGFSSVAECAEDGYKILTEQWESTHSVCAKVTLEVQQVLSMKRPAYRGTLTVFNGHEEKAMQDVRLNIVVEDKNGKIATAREFQINAESLDSFEGTLDMNSGWTLDAQKTGIATILFIPTKYAAPTAPVQYTFGGTLTYVDPFTGLEVTRDLYPVTLTVYPSPDLELTYLMQRDVYGDDPLTEDVVEPKEPAEFALIINNKGYGEAKNVRMLTEQPRITENEKGLLVDFQLVSSQVDGQPATLSFGKTIANNFGNIPAHSQSYAQWWLESSLLGHFTSYEVETTHVTSYGNQNLSLIDTVTIHEMLHGFTDATALSSKLRRGYLVNDIVDADDMPDVVYFTDATQQPLYISRGNIDRLGNSEYMLTATTKQQGWNYGSVPDPTGGRLKLASVTRSKDGAELPIDNMWQTNRTLRDGIEWFYDNRLHYVVWLPDGDERYVLTFTKEDEVSVKPIEISKGHNEDIHLRLLGNVLTVTGNIKEISVLSIYDMRGSKVFVGSDIQPGSDINISSLKPGAYIFKIDTDKGLFHTKILKK